MSFTFWFILILAAIVVVVVILKLIDRRNSVKMFNPWDTEKIESGKKKYYRPELVEAKVRSLFPNHDPKEILELLEDVHTFSGRERTQLNVLKLSGGNLDQLRHYIDVANSERDFLQVTNAAEYPEFSQVPLKEIDRRPYDEMMGRLKRDTKQYIDWVRSK